MMTSTISVLDERGYTADRTIESVFSVIKIILRSGVLRLVGIEHELVYSIYI